MKMTFRLLGFLAILATVSCGDVVRDGRSPVMLGVDSLQGIRGGTTAGTPSGTLTSDVLTLVTSPAPCSTATPCATVFGDGGQVTLRLVLKNIGNPASPSTPSTNNEVTIDRYHVRYYRADGHNREGVDVPYAFDGAFSGTVPANASATFGFVLVRNIAKSESPLVQLATNRSIVTTFADVTFYGRDRVGNDVSVTGTIEIDFGNFGD